MLVSTIRILWRQLEYMYLEHYLTPIRQAEAYLPHGASEETRTLISWLEAMSHSQLDHTRLQTKNDERRRIRTYFVEFSGVNFSHAIAT